jgi:nucleotide-binding universal stress UspA family protein
MLRLFSTTKEVIMVAQRFLVPLDFSPYADQALDYAIALAQQLHAHMTLLHVIQPLATGGTDLGVVLPYTYIQELEEGILSALDTALDKVTAAGLKGERLMVHGVPFHEIVDAAQRRQADLIIMGTHGRTGLTHIFLGSVAEKVVRLAPCPVLVVRQPVKA